MQMPTAQGSLFSLRTCLLDFLSLLSITLEWQSTPMAKDAVNPAKFDQHQQVNFLDLDTLQ
jgi:hypothetical protein